MIDLQNTKEGRIVSQKYGDILELERPEPSPKHPRMSMVNRAKQFSPFAALRGYGDELEQERSQFLHVAKAALTEEEQEALGEKLRSLNKGQQVTVRYFQADLSEFSDTGVYVTMSGTVQKVDGERQVLCLGLEPSQCGPGLKKSQSIEIPFGDMEAIL